MLVFHNMGGGGRRERETGLLVPTCSYCMCTHPPTWVNNLLNSVTHSCVYLKPQASYHNHVDMCDCLMVLWHFGEVQGQKYYCCMYIIPMLMSSVMTSNKRLKMLSKKIFWWGIHAWIIVYHHIAFDIVVDEITWKWHGGVCRYSLSKATFFCEYNGELIKAASVCKLSWCREFYFSPQWWTLVVLCISLVVPIIVALRQLKMTVTMEEWWTTVRSPSNAQLKVFNINGVLILCLMTIRHKSV